VRSEHQIGGHVSNTPPYQVLGVNSREQANRLLTRFKQYVKLDVTFPLCLGGENVHVDVWTSILHPCIKYPTLSSSVCRFWMFLMGREVYGLPLLDPELCA